MSLDTEMVSLVAGTITKQVLVLAGPLGVVQLLGADTRRLYVEFWRGPTAALMREVIPGPVPSGYTGRTSVEEPLIRKFKDCPALVAGEWYGDQQAGIDWRIVEVCVQPGV